MPKRANLTRCLPSIASRVAAVALVGLAASLQAAPTQALGDTSTPHVTLIGDSVADALAWAPATEIAAQGIDLELEVAPCRRIEAPSCSVNGVFPPTVMDLVASAGPALGPTVIVVMGYNDPDDEYRADVGDALDALSRAGVKRVLWLTLHESRHPYVTMNDDTASWARTHPELMVLDWNAYSRSHDDWFQGDGLHLVPDGAIAMATFIHSALVSLGIALPPPAPAGTTTTTTTTTTTQPAAAAPLIPVKIVSRKLPTAIEGRPYLGRLTASGGRPPYRWTHQTKLPHGFGLARDGLVTGIPRTGPGSFDVFFRVTDASGRHATRRIVLSVNR